MSSVTQGPENASENVFTRYLSWVWDLQSMQAITPFFEHFCVCVCVIREKRGQVVSLPTRPQADEVQSDLERSVELHQQDCVPTSPGKPRPPKGFPVGNY